MNRSTLLFGAVGLLAMLAGCGGGSGSGGTGTAASSSSSSASSVSSAGVGVDTFTPSVIVIAATSSDTAQPIATDAFIATTVDTGAPLVLN